MTQKFQLALNVENLEAAIKYYGKLFGVRVNKRKPGYANFSIEKPPLKLVLFENPGATEHINHLGVENFDQADVDSAIERFTAAGIADEQEVSSSCCYARQNKVWSTDPSGIRWEWYRILEDTEDFGSSSHTSSKEDGICCAG